MNMDSIAHEYLTKLRIISKIPENGQLDTTNNDLNIYSPTLLSWLWRKFQGDGKTNSVKYLLDLYKKINLFTDQLIIDIINEKSETKKRKNMILLVSITEKLKESLKGINHLSGTYKDFPKIVSMIECIEQDIIIPQYNYILNKIPENYHTKILKRKCMYLRELHISDDSIPINQPEEKSMSNENKSRLNINDNDLNNSIILNNNTQKIPFLNKPKNDKIKFLNKPKNPIDSRNL